MLSNHSIRFLVKGIRSFVSISKKNYFSPAFTCESSWNKRLETPLLKKCNLEDLYYELESKYNQSENISAIDVDIFVNSIKDSSHLEEMQDLVHKLRLSSEACNILESTHHAFIRSLLNNNRYDDLIGALNDRLNYGIFPDDYSVLLMLDTFLKMKDYKNAAKVSSMYMLQEDFQNELINYLSLYSCHQYLLNPTEWEKPKEVIEDDGEEVKIRVNYLRNPYFDEHFDLIESNDLIGKTFVLVGKEFNNSLGLSYQLYGYILFKKLSNAENFIRTVIENKQKIHKDVLDLAIKSLEEMKENERAENLKTLCNEIIKNNLIEENEALHLLDRSIKDIVKKNETDLISQQEQKFNKWIETRDEVLKESLNKIKIEERLSQVKLIREELAKKEQELFFFDKEDQIDLEIERKQQLAEEDKADSNKTSKTSADDYKPPEIIKRRHNS